MAGLTDESVSPTFVPQGLRFCGAGALAQCHIVFPLPNICTNRGADPLVCGRRPRRPAGVCLMPISLFRLRDEGVPRGPGGPPSNLRPDPAVAKTMWH